MYNVHWCTQAIQKLPHYVVGVKQIYYSTLQIENK